MLKPQNASHVTYYMALELSFHFNLFYSTQSLQELDGKQRHGSVAVWRLQRLPSVTSYPKQVGTPGASNGCSVGRIMKNHKKYIWKKHPHIRLVQCCLFWALYQFHVITPTLTKLFGGKGRFVEESGDVEVCKIDF